MSIEIRELRPSSCEEVAALFAASDAVTHGISSAADVVRAIGRHRGLSLVATVDGEIVGAAICETDRHGGFVQHVAVAAGDDEKEIRERLAGVAACKLSRKKVGKCCVKLSGVECDHDFWEQLAWRGGDEDTATPVQFERAVPDPTAVTDADFPTLASAEPAESAASPAKEAREPQAAALTSA